MKINYQANNYYLYKYKRAYKGNNTYAHVPNPGCAVFQKTDSKRVLGDFLCLNPAPVSFGQIPSSTRAFEIKEVENLRCPICGKVMLSQKQIDEFVNNVHDKKGVALVIALEKYGSADYWTKDKNSFDMVYNQQKQEIVDIIAKMAYDNPNLSLSELVRMHAKHSLDELISQQIDVIDELEKYIALHVKDADERRAVSSILFQALQTIQNNGAESFKRKKFLYAIKDKVSNIDVQDEINSIASRLPTSKDNINAFFVKYSKEGRSSREIARNLVSQNLPTADHLVCQSNKGSNAIENYICDCAGCNSTRMSTPFDVWTRDIPNVREHLQAYIDEIQKLIIEGKFSFKYDFYTQDIARTIYKLTEGEIRLETMDVNSKEFEPVIKRRRQEYKNLCSEVEKLEARVQRLTNWIMEADVIMRSYPPDTPEWAKGEYNTEEVIRKGRECSIARNMLVQCKLNRDLLANYSKKYNIEM